MEEMLRLKLLNDLVHTAPAARKRTNKHKDKALQLADVDEHSNAALVEWLEKVILPAWNEWRGWMTLERLKCDTAAVVARFHSEIEQRTIETKTMFKQSRLFSSSSRSSPSTSATGTPTASPRLPRPQARPRKRQHNHDESQAASPVALSRSVMNVAAAANTSSTSSKPTDGVVLIKLKQKLLNAENKHKSAQVQVEAAANGSDVELLVSPPRSLLMPPPQLNQLVASSPHASRSAHVSECSPEKSLISLSSSNSNSNSLTSPPTRPVSGGSSSHSSLQQPNPNVTASNVGGSPLFSPRVAELQSPQKSSDDDHMPLAQLSSRRRKNAAAGAGVSSVRRQLEAPQASNQQTCTSTVTGPALHASVSAAASSSHSSFAHNKPTSSSALEAASTSASAPAPVPSQRAAGQSPQPQVKKGLQVAISTQLESLIPIRPVAHTTLHQYSAHSHPHSSAQPRPRLPPPPPATSSTTAVSSSKGASPGSSSHSSAPAPTVSKAAAATSSPARSSTTGSASSASPRGLQGLQAIALAGARAPASSLSPALPPAPAAVSSTASTCKSMFSLSLSLIYPKIHLTVIYMH